MEFRLLGPVELWAAGKQHDLGSTKERCILAVLLMAEGRPVSVEALIDRVWNDDPPAEVRRSLHVDVSRLRRCLRAAELDHQADLRAMAHTYALDIDPDTVDLHRFRRLRVQAASILDSGDRKEAAVLLREAEQLWRGEPLAGLSGQWVERCRVGLDSEYRSAAFGLADIELSMGHHADMIGYLLGLTERYPLDETLARRLMVAYYRCGRQADALRFYLTISRSLSTETGVDPSPELQELQQRILHHDPSLGYVPQPLFGQTRRPHTLPDPVTEFTGRVEEIGVLTAASDASASDAASNVTVIEGMPGIGKTTLAIRIAHELADRYPDGCLHLHLHAHDPQRLPAEPTQALATLLRMLGHSPARIPRTRDERAELWRSELVGRRVLIVLDDAADGEQVRPLLPGSAGCRTIVTSRRTLRDLPGAHSTVLGVLPHDDAVALFTRFANPGAPLPTEMVAVAVKLCGYLPLAIRMAATHVRDGHVSSIEALNEQMREIRQDLADAPAPDVAAAFELSYRDLTSAQRQAFRRLGLSPVPELTVPAVAALAGVPQPEAERVLAELSEHSLLEALGSGRFRFHDLIRQYARTLTERDDPAAVRRQAVGRMLDYFLYTADRADRLLYPQCHRHDVTVDPGPYEPASFATAEGAQAWMSTEWRTLFLAVQYAADHGWNTHAIELADAVAQFFDDAVHWEEADEIHRRALMAGQELEIPWAAAQAHLNLAIIQWRTGRNQDAFASTHEARRLYHAIAEPAREAAALDQTGLILWLSSDYRSALAYFSEAHDIYRLIDDANGQAGCLGHAGMALWHTGRYSEALDSLRTALAMYRDLENLRGQANTLNNTGDVLLHMGYHRDAAQLYTESQDIYRMVTGRRNRAILLANLGNVDQYKGHLRSALRLYRSALAEFSMTGDRLNECGVLNDIGSTLCRGEQYDESLIHHRKASSVAESIGHRYELIRARLGIAEANAGMGRYSTALDSYRESLLLARETGDLYLEARTLNGIADATLRIDGRDSARIYWRQAHDLFMQLGMSSQAESLRIRLEDARTVGS